MTISTLAKQMINNADVVDVMDETLINITETKVYEGKAEFIPTNYLEHKIISMRPEFKNKEFFIKLFV